MSYTIGNIIYGFNLNNEILQFIDELDLSERLNLCRSLCSEEHLNSLLENKSLEEPIEVLRALGFEILYCSGNGYNVGYFGTLLCKIDETSTIDVEKLSLTPTEQNIEDLKIRLDKFPSILRQFTAACKVYIVWSSS